MNNKEIILSIDGKECKSTFGKTILEIARENDIYIPTMCHLTKVKPIASCRMCLVDVEGVEGAILSCQEKATDGAVIVTQNSDLFDKRQDIMKLYNVNHPLECGVCDQSGECDLQNKTMEFNVEAQPFTTKDQHRPVENWGHISYNPALCIMCEKCVRVSTEITGDEALSLQFGGYSSTILNNKKEKNYASLGEAASVCPVGALVDTNFKYSANAWELNKVPSSCSHCSSACELSYETKDNTIYRVSNTYDFSSLCGAGRYAFDYDNKDVIKDKKAFDEAVQNVRECESIIFSSQISNEEAYILQKIKEKYKKKLISQKARDYQRFMAGYSQITGKKLYNANLKDIASSTAVIVVGTKINDDNPMVKYHINMASKHHRARVVYMHPVEDAELKSIVTQFIKYEVSSEEAVLAMLVDTLLKGKDVPQNIRNFLDELDIGNLSAMSNIGEEELDALSKSLLKKSNFSLVVGADLYGHKRASHIAKLVGIIEKYANFNVICVPPTTNALGVSLICELDDEREGKSVGYNALGDFTLSSLNDGDLDMPSLNQQEGTLTNIDKRVVPLNVALEYGGYILNDIASALDISVEHTIDYTKTLPQKSGFKSKNFDDLPNYFDITGVEHRGYLLENVSTENDETLEEVQESDIFDGAILYNTEGVDQFSAFTNLSSSLVNPAFLLGSEQFSMMTKLQENESISFEIDGVKFTRVFKIDTSLKGTIALNPTYDMGLSSPLVSSYRFNRLDFTKNNNEKVGS